MKVGDLALFKPFDPVIQRRSEHLAQNMPRSEVKFSDSLNEFVDNVNQEQKDAGKKIEQLITGEPIDLHDVMIAAEKAKTSFSLLMELRNKALDMYREVIRIQV